MVDDRVGQTVAEAMLRVPTVSAADVTAGELRVLFDDDHLHAAVVVQQGRLLAVVERADLAGAPEDALAAGLAGLQGRVVGPYEELEPVRREMVRRGRRRLAVVDDDGLLLGLLCLKRSGRGFCTDRDVAARAAEARSGDTC